MLCILLGFDIVALVYLCPTFYTLESVLSDFVNMVCLVMELNGMYQQRFYVTEWCSIS